MRQITRLNIFVIPSGQGRVYNFQFHRVTLAFLAGLALATQAILMGYAYYSYRVNGGFIDRSGRMEALIATNSALEAQAATFVSALNSLEDKLYRLGNLETARSTLTDEIRVQLGLPLEVSDSEVLPRLAAAVSWSAPPGGASEEQEGGSRYLIRNLNLDLERLMALADQTERRLNLINDGLSGTGSILAATPTILPLNNPISSRFGLRQSPFGSRRSIDFHRGLDIPAPPGTTIHAPADGTVLACGNSGNGYGLMMTIDHGYGLVTRYGHLERILVEPGQTILRGQPVAKSGNTGRSTGPHLHYEILLGGVAADPLELLAAVSPTLSRGVKLLDAADFRGNLPYGAAVGVGP
ncbi:MAG: M23 family metallopeptidase [Candidatus Adiutrix sp.]|nr:M23 family metallopeptidase [Candidatus Adiutrix sp.]